ncbi:hypothetical protein H5410_004201 [Solanum commersonii]|uniref:SNF2 N-terminal domain-containing protein n=1 Tax=Solanum commersonii TaxID=4109 RepID=A0A9J6B7F3_SOLCO|nr:hypothetical protein H5410_004201 [Solanum commersonii]
MVNLNSWEKSMSVLRIHYVFFRILTGKDGDGYAKETREILLKFPSLLVLDEGHTARNQHRFVWNTLQKIETEKNILFLDLRSRITSRTFTTLSISNEKNAQALEELRDIMSPLFHKCSENVKKTCRRSCLKEFQRILAPFMNKFVVSDLYSSFISGKEERLDPDIGVKMIFVVELIRLCSRRKERVIIFSQLLDPLKLIKEQINSLFGRTLGR